MHHSLKNKRILFLGGSQGIGLAAARAAHAEGAQVLIAARNKEKLDAAVAQIGEDVSTFKVDVTQENSVRDLFDAVRDIDHLIVTAASALISPLHEQKTESLRGLIDSKLIGQTLAVKYGAPRLREGGSIVLSSGIVSRKPLPGASAYAAVGAATEAAARIWALEYAPVRINVVLPGIIDTPAWDLLMPEEAKKEHFAAVAGQLPVGRVGDADDVAQAALFFARSPFITGACLEVDGGHRIV